MSPDFDERDALTFDCPDCGAAPGVRCRILTPNVTNPKRTKVDVRRKPCAGRVTVAWRAHLGQRTPADDATPDDGQLGLPTEARSGLEDAFLRILRAR